MIDEHLRNAVAFSVFVVHIAHSTAIKLNDVGTWNGQKYRRVRDNTIYNNCLKDSFYKSWCKMKFWS